MLTIKKLPPPHIRQNNAHCRHVEEYSDDRTTTPTAGHHDASQSNAQNYLRRKFGDFSVQWLPLGEVAEFYGGLTGKTKHDFGNGNSKYVTYKNIYSNIEIDNNAFEYVDVHPEEKQNKIKYGDILVTGSSENLEDAGMTSVVTCEIKEDIYLNSFSFGIRFKSEINLIPEFAKYLFRCDYIRQSIKKTASGVTRYNVSKTRFKNIVIPIPPLEVQAEVVRILDKFSRLTSELQKELDAELKARKLQYEYYRDQLLSFGTDDPTVQWLPLGEVCNISRGASPRPISKYITESDDGVNWIKIGDAGSYKYITSTKERITLEGASKSKYLHKGDFILSNSMSFGKPYILEIDGCIHDGWIAVTDLKDIIIKDFLYYVLKSDFIQHHWEQSVSKGTVSNLNSDIVKKTVIPIPSIEEQERIVGILDKFDKLTNSLTEGIPKEIEMRQLQYEYYRDALLSF